MDNGYSDVKRETRVSVESMKGDCERWKKRRETSGGRNYEVLELIGESLNRMG